MLDGHPLASVDVGDAMIGENLLDVVEKKDHNRPNQVFAQISESRMGRCIDRFLKGLPHCTAIVCCNYMIYRLVRQVLDKQGRRVPGDCSLVCFDYSGQDWEAEGVTCSIHQGREIGREVASRLMRMIQNQDCEDKSYSYVLAPQIYIGRSIGPVHLPERR